MNSLDLFKYIKDALVNKQLPLEQKIRLLEFSKMWFESDLYPKDVDIMELYLTSELDKPDKLDKLDDIKNVSQSTAYQKAIEDLEQAMSKATERVGPKPPLKISNDKNYQESNPSIDNIRNGSITDKDKKRIRDGLVSDLRTLAALAFTSISASDMCKKDHSTSRSMLHCANMSTQISNYVVDQILDSEDIDKAKQLYQFFVGVASKCIKKNDYFSAMNILSALSNFAVAKLKNTEKGGFQIDTKIKDKFKKSEDTLSNIGSYKNLRDELSKKKEIPPIPPVIMYSKDLTFAKDGNSSVDKTSNEFKQARLEVLEKIVKEAHHLQKPLDPSKAIWKTDINDIIKQRKTKEEDNKKKIFDEITQKGEISPEKIEESVSKRIESERDKSNDAKAVKMRGQ